MKKKPGAKAKRREPLSIPFGSVRMIYLESGGCVPAPADRAKAARLLREAARKRKVARGR